MTAYYNEHDTFAAAWLRELIKAGLIAPGDVDDRSIADVRAVKAALEPYNEETQARAMITLYAQMIAHLSPGRLHG